MRRGGDDQQNYHSYVGHRHEHVCWYAHDCSNRNYSRVIVMTAIWAIITGAIVSLIALSVLYNLTLQQEEEPEEKIVIREVSQSESIESMLGFFHRLDAAQDAEETSFHNVMSRHREAHLAVRS